MIAAIYSRKSNEQNGIADETKSVARQAAHARAYAEKHGWIVDESHIYVDDAISGAEFANRPGFVRLMNALKPRAPFQFLVVSELSRLGREQFETGYALKQLSQAGVRIFSYLEDREVLLDTPTDKFLMSAVSFAAEIERDKARQRVTDAMTRKARMGACCGGVLFGYDNVEVGGIDGRRSHVERRINETEASIVRRIFALCAAGKGVKGIAKLLNAEGVPSPRPKLGRPRAWAPSSVRAALHNDLYRGVQVWNKRKHKDAWGQRTRSCRIRPESEWITADLPQLRIVTDEAWAAAHARLQSAAAVYIRLAKGRLGGRPPSGIEGKHLQSGLGCCALCGASMVCRATSRRRQIYQTYLVCAGYDMRGRAVCANGMRLPMGLADDAVLTTVSDYVLDPEVVEGAIADAIRELRPSREAAESRRVSLRADLIRLDAEQGRFVAAIAAAGQVEALAAALRDNERHRVRLRQELATLDGLDDGTFDMRQVERDLRERLVEWRGLLRRQTPIARQVLLRLIDGRIAWTPCKDQGLYEFAGRVKFDRLLSGVVVTAGMVPVRGFEPRFDG